uniref:Uncharacterized protein n=1 Tax=viral metagenome TaxID=1070528 RepID=A0A6H2A249_9ZZZZ
MDKCVICEKDVPDYKPIYCCSGEQCSCRGLPIQPPTCSYECELRLVAGIGKPYNER